MYAYLFATIAYVLTALCYAELSSSYHQTGGAFTFAKRAFGRNVAFVAAWALLLDYLVTISISALAAVGYVGYFFPVLHVPQITGLATLCVIVGLMTLNIVGLSESAKFSYFLVIFDLIGEATVLIIGYVFSFKPGLNIIHFGTVPTYPSFLYAVTIAMSSYLGIEVISQSAGETKNASRNIPRAIFLISATVVAATLAFSTLALGVLPYQAFQQNPTSINDPVSFIAEHLRYGWILGGLTAILGISVLTVAANAGVVGVSRITFAMSEEGVIPKFFGKLHKKYNSPYVSIIIFSLLAIALAFSGRLDLVAELYNFGALIAYMIVGLSMISLRNKDRALVRPFKNPWSIRIKRVGQSRQEQGTSSPNKANSESATYYEIPVIGLLCFIADFIIWILVVILHPLGRTFGSAWMGAGLLMFYVYTKIKSSKNKEGSLRDFPSGAK